MTYELVNGAREGDELGWYGALFSALLPIATSYAVGEIQARQAKKAQKRRLAGLRAEVSEELRLSGGKASQVVLDPTAPSGWRTVYAVSSTKRFTGAPSAPKPGETSMGIRPVPTMGPPPPRFTGAAQPPRPGETSMGIRPRPPASPLPSPVQIPGFVGPPAPPIVIQTAAPIAPVRPPTPAFGTTSPPAMLLAAGAAAVLLFGRAPRRRRSRRRRRR